MFERAQERIVQNGYFDVERVGRLRGCLGQLEEYFTNIEPLAYLDDISSKNLLIHNGRTKGNYLGPCSLFAWFFFFLLFAGMEFLSFLEAGFFATL